MKRNAISASETALDRRKQQMNEQLAEIKKQEADILQKKASLKEYEDRLARDEYDLGRRNANLDRREAEIENQEATLNLKTQRIIGDAQSLIDKEMNFEERKAAETLSKILMQQRLEVDRQEALQRGEGRDVIERKKVKNPMSRNTNNKVVSSKQSVKTENDESKNLI